MAGRQVHIWLQKRKGEHGTGSMSRTGAKLYLVSLGSRPADMIVAGKRALCAVFGNLELGQRIPLSAEVTCRNHRLWGFRALSCAEAGEDRRQQARGELMSCSDRFSSYMSERPCAATLPVDRASSAVAS